MKDLEKKIDAILTQGVGGFVDPKGKFKQKLLSKASGENVGEVIIKFGVDPTRPDIHLGHAVVLQKLRQFQDLGCKVVFLVGDVTAGIGDPTGKDKVRPAIGQEEIEANMHTYLAQVGGILSLEPAVFSWIRNSDWFYTISDIAPGEGKVMSVEEKALLYKQTRMQLTHLKKPEILDVTLRGLLWTLKYITHAQLIERDMFQKRLKEGGALYMHEMLYPVLQGIDSFAIHKIYGECDLEIGGTDQTFNMLMGREVMKINGQPEQAVMSVEILVGTDGKEKMSKSLGNYIGITDTSGDMLGKVMSIPDSAIINYYELCTKISVDELNKIKLNLQDPKNNPRDAKLALGEEIVALYYGRDEAIKAREGFIATFQKKEIPEEVVEIKADRDTPLVDMLIQAEVVSSKTDWRRLVERGAVKLLKEGGVEEKVIDPQIRAVAGVYRIGKKRFVKVS